MKMPEFINDLPDEKKGDRFANLLRNIYNDKIEVENKIPTNHTYILSEMNEWAMQQCFTNVIPKAAFGEMQDAEQMVRGLINKYIKNHKNFITNYDLMFAQIIYNNKITFNDFKNHMTNKHPVGNNYKKYIIVQLMIYYFDKTNAESKRRQHGINFMDNKTGIISLNSINYKPTAFIIHQGGTSIEGGHYIAIINYGDRWFSYSDTNITIIGNNDNLSNHFVNIGSGIVHMVLYEQVSPKS